MTGKRIAFLLLLSAAFGYGIHDTVSIGAVKLLSRTQILSNKSQHESVLGQVSNDQFMVRITYTGNRFEPDYVTMRSGNYLLITNTSKTTLMWISSNMPGLMTTRGYAEGEQFRFMATSEGTYVLKDKLNPDATVTLRIQK